MSKVYFWAPAVLSSVCRRWREIALAVPALWTDVFINSWRKPDQFTKEWLNRSRSVPLRLTIYADDSKLRRKNWNTAFHSMCKILRSHSARWGYINVEYAATNCLHVLFNNLQVMPKSDSFHLRLGSHYCQTFVRAKTPLQPGRFSSTMTQGLEMMSCEWQNLTHLELCHYRIGEVLDIIRAAPNLKRCVSQKMRHAMVKNAVPVEHRVLEDLEVSFKGSGTKFFQNITLPSLRHCRYDACVYSNSNDDEEFHDLMNFLVRSDLKHRDPPLQTLTLGWHSSSIPDYEVCGILAMDALTHLVIESSILPSLLSELSNLSVCPNLRQIEVLITAFEPGDEFDELESFRAVLSRFMLEHKISFTAPPSPRFQGGAIHWQDVDLSNITLCNFRSLLGIILKIKIVTF